MPACPATLSISAVSHLDHPACRITTTAGTWTFWTFVAGPDHKWSSDHDVVALVDGDSKRTGYATARRRASDWLRCNAGDMRAEKARLDVAHLAEQSRIRNANRGSNAMIG